MANIDLGTAAGFARATMSDTAAILLALTGRGASEWDIQEGSYNGVLFHVFKSKESYQGAVGQVTDTTGRRKVKFRFPYKDGQTTDDLGKKAEDFEFDILIHGQNYMQGFRRLMAELDKPTPGDLVHPVRGRIRVVPEDVQIIHSSEKRMAVAIRLKFTEHNFTIGELTTLKDPTTKGALARALDAFSLMDQTLSNVLGAALFVQSLKNQISAAIATYKEAYGVLLQLMNSAFNDGESVDIPTLLPVNEGGAGTPGSGATFPGAISPSDPFASAPASVLAESTTTALAVEELKKKYEELRAQLNAILALIESGAGGRGGLILYQDIVDLKQSAILMQDVLEKGIASSQARIVEYVTPRIMSLREVAFLNGLPVDRVNEIDLLNPTLLSTNYIEAGTSLKVPQS